MLHDGMSSPEGPSKHENKQGRMYFNTDCFMFFNPGCLQGVAQSVNNMCSKGAATVCRNTQQVLIETTDNCIQPNCMTGCSKLTRMQCWVLRLMYMRCIRMSHALHACMLPMFVSVCVCSTRVSVSVVWSMGVSMVSMSGMHG